MIYLNVCRLRVRSPRTETDSFRFWYVDSAGECVREKDCALVAISGVW